MNYSQAAKEIAKRFNLTISESEKILGFLWNRLSEDLVDDQRVYFRGFGALHRDYRPERKYRDPRTGRMKVRAAYFDVDFRTAKKLLNKLNRKKG
ncbi:MAG: HU family DNA-binding protein [Candidatus Omnitrophica bacterium]|nr:HU family DNA-binding protein [Candidatus Omnitrophota bacterium]MBU1134743.1 HU family DNA-binding protein [Candidatus Omnitrophota bacterium]MBU1811100.1 HU family DNA-binding protein [Candidatus Omnitrophota bacterium]